MQSSGPTCKSKTLYGKLLGAFLSFGGDFPKASKMRDVSGRSRSCAECTWHATGSSLLGGYVCLSGHGFRPTRGVLQYVAQYGHYPGRFFSRATAAI